MNHFFLKKRKRKGQKSSTKDDYDEAFTLCMRMTDAEERAWGHETLNEGHCSSCVCGKRSSPDPDEEPRSIEKYIHMSNKLCSIISKKAHDKSRFIRLSGCPLRKRLGSERERQLVVSNNNSALVERRRESSVTAFSSGQTDQKLHQP